MASSGPHVRTSCYLYASSPRRVLPLWLAIWPIASAASVSLWNRPPTMGLLCYGPLGPVVGPLDLGVFLGLGRGNVYVWAWDLSMGILWTDSGFRCRRIQNSEFRLGNRLASVFFDDLANTSHGRSARGRNLCCHSPPLATFLKLS